MYRRIEIIFPRHEERAEIVPEYKRGCNKYGDIMNNLGLKAPKKIRTLKKFHFWFTEKGWQEVGRHVLSQIKKDGMEYKLLKIKENAMGLIVYKDSLQIAGRVRSEKRMA